MTSLYAPAHPNSIMLIIPFSSQTYQSKQAHATSPQKNTNKRYKEYSSMDLFVFFSLTVGISSKHPRLFALKKILIDKKETWRYNRALHAHFKPNLRQLS